MAWFKKDKPECSFVVGATVTRKNDLDDSTRMTYATELLDTYNAFGITYIQEKIKQSYQSETIKNNLLKLTICYPILENFINSFSMIYKQQPQRVFYIDGKIIVSEKTHFNFELDKEKYIVDTDLYNTLNGIYTREFMLSIKQAEEYTNLFSTTIYKINNRDDKLCFDFIANDLVRISENEDDITKMQEVCFQKGTNDVQHKIYARWTPDEYKIYNQNEDRDLEVLENRAMTAYRTYVEKPDLQNVGWGFPPFVVLRSDVATCNFWDIKDKDVIELIKQINLAFTEMRYLQRYGSFGLKYILNGKLPNDTNMDLIGIVEMSTDSDMPEANRVNNATEVGEFKNEGRIEVLTESIIKMLKTLYILKNIPMDRFITSQQATTAESKYVDRQALEEMIAKQKDIWHINEENIFKTCIAVYNRDNPSSRQLPKGLSIKVDFADNGNDAESKQKEIENWQVRIANDVKNVLDWVIAENPDLNETEAMQVYQYNKKINESDVVVTDDTDEPSDTGNVDETDATNTE